MKMYVYRKTKSVFRVIDVYKQKMYAENSIMDAKYCHFYYYNQD